MKHGRSEDRALIRRLQAAGCPIPADLSSEPEPDLLIEVSTPESTVAYDVRGGGVEFAFAVRITNRSYARLAVQRFRASPSWGGDLLWRGDPRIYTPERTVFRFQNGREFPCEQVLNYSTGEQATVEPGGGSLVGLLLGYTMFDRIPCEYMHGSIASADLCVIDQFGRQHWSEIELLINRTATMRPIRPAGSRSTLFDGPKPEYRALALREPPQNRTGTESVNRFFEFAKEVPGNHRCSSRKA